MQIFAFVHLLHALTLEQQVNHGTAKIRSEGLSDRC